MPIHHYVLFDSATGAHTCAQGSSVTVDLVQDAIVQLDSTYVESITVTYSPDPWPNTDFVLVIARTDSRYTINPISPVDLEGENGSTAQVTTTLASFIVVFSAPTDSGTKLFEFGDDSGPPTKLQVKIKTQPTTYSC
jgi:hypothetical protein